MGASIRRTSQMGTFFFGKSEHRARRVFSAEIEPGSPKNRRYIETLS